MGGGWCEGTKVKAERMGCCIGSRIEGKEFGKKRVQVHAFEIGRLDWSLLV